MFGQQGAESPTRADGRTFLKSRSRGAHRKPGVPSGTGRAAAALATAGLAIAGLGVIGSAAQADTTGWNREAGGLTSGGTPSWLGIYAGDGGLYGVCGLEGTKPGPQDGATYTDPVVLTSVDVWVGW